MAVMQEEIFGPLLPVEAYATLDDAIAEINARPRPLALYCFGHDARARARARETLAGGVTVNDTLWHFAHEDLPFGGVGASGIGAYHGERGFPHVQPRESVFVQPRFAAANCSTRPTARLREGARVAEAPLTGGCLHPLRGIARKGRRAGIRPSDSGDHRCVGPPRCWRRQGWRAFPPAKRWRTTCPPPVQPPAGQTAAMTWTGTGP